MTHWPTWLRSKLWSSPHRTLRETIAFQARAYERAVTLVRVFYAGSALLMIGTIGQWPSHLRVETVAAPWPVDWLSPRNLDWGVGVVLFCYLLGTLWATALPQWRSARIVCFLALLQYVAFINGFGKINHDYHGWLWVSGLLVLLPSGGWHDVKRVADRHTFMTVLWSCQLVVLFFYTLSGMWKIYWAVRDYFDPDTLSSLQIDGFSYIIANRLVVTNQETVLGEFIVRHPLLGWVCFTGMTYVETCSVVIAFRPRLHRVWGLGLILFHTGTYLMMGFTFYPNVLLVGLLFVCSPWAPERIAVRDAFLDLPGVHLIARRLRPPRRGPPDAELSLSDDRGARPLP
jgi:hypothetical protein